ncbi:acyl-CoA N-acyltransferase with RING/FYVE/PHD-type zinc finger domain-containing protein [Actinidia rufa]|uniref:Acyl-CoA N-acyltransferase with RING/FYVE/PHD-type zinc finger domain-containing protein n=1 Tax=Actinidia rufa TaxID=165716 RepID=A0A7J0GJV5_9ERIC|nr:acyl-CoA N-acyltransferase with RING/FYVE/PHD-type zinc finger domain-containing protein [Actinidia rufa]
MLLRNLEHIKVCLDGRKESLCGSVERETVKNEDFSRIEFKRDHESIGDDAEAEPCTKKQEREDLFDTGLVSCANKQFKEASNDEIFSEVSNPNLSPRDNACSQTISSQLAELVSNDQVGEMASTCSGNSSTESPSEEEQSKNGTLGAVSASHFVVEIPKHVSSTGIRKITFKFGKRKEDYDNQLSNTTVQSMADGVL